MKELSGEIPVEPSPVVGETAESEGVAFADVKISPQKSIFDADGALTREFLLDRGHCCGNGCRNCPYDRAAEPR